LKKKDETQSSPASGGLAQKKCTPCKGGVHPLDSDGIESHLKQLLGWKLQDGALTKTFTFRDYYEITAFVNAVAWIAHREDHHPDITFGYKNCRIVFITHAVKGLTENDFIAAAKVDRIFS